MDASDAADTTDVATDDDFADASDVADASDTDACGRTIESGAFLNYRDSTVRTYGSVPVCCGHPSEITGVTCVDLSVDGGEYGIFGRCFMSGETYEGKVAGGRCCGDLAAVSLPIAVSTDPNAPRDFIVTAADGATEVCVFIDVPSGKLCLPCGNGVCEPPDEDICNCPQDCK